MAGGSAGAVADGSTARGEVVGGTSTNVVGAGEGRCGFQRARRLRGAAETGGDADRQHDEGEGEDLEMARPPGEHAQRHGAVFLSG